MPDSGDRSVEPEAGRQKISAQWRARFRAEMVSGIGFAFKARLAALAAITLWLSVSLAGNPMLPFYLLALLVAAASGLVVYLARSTPWVTSAHFLGLIVDVVLICGVLLYPQPGQSAGDWALQLWLRRGIFLYLMVYVALSALTYSPTLVLLAGAVAAIGLIAAYAYVVSVVDGGMATMQKVLGPHLMTPNQFVSNQVVLMAIACGVLAAAVWRARRHVMRSVEVEIERTNLARYFSPNLVERLADADRSFEAGRVQTAAVLFVDIVGFTRLMEGEPPDRTVAMLRAFHRRMAEAVFRNGGTLDKFIGDGLMATFGTPEPDRAAARRALACALDMANEVESWNRQRRERGYPAVRTAVGIHIGPVMLGTIGSPQRLEFTVIGDTVNIASRLERLARDLDATIVVSDEVLQAARQAGADDAALQRFSARGEAHIAGRQAPISVWTVPCAAALSPTAGRDAKLDTASHNH